MGSHSTHGGRGAARNLIGALSDTARYLLKSRSGKSEMISGGPLDVFVSYAHEDKDLRDRLLKHLKLLEREGKVRCWHDRKITAGKEWAAEIDTHLRTANVIILLISTDFLASDYCSSVEMTLAMQRHDAAEARVVPIILKNCSWESVSPLSRLQALPQDGRPVKDWRNRDKAFLDIQMGLSKAIDEELERIVTRRIQYRCIGTDRPVNDLVDRQEFAEIRDFMCTAVPGGGAAVGITVALQGGSGAGKTAIAQALCYDDRVRAIFADGILWTDVGDRVQEADLIDRIQELILRWSNRNPPRYERIGAASDQLRRLLNNQRVLLVVDNVRNSSDLEPFRVVGPEAALLVTAPCGEVLPSDCILFNIGAMRTTEAVSLLGAGITQINAARMDLDRLAERLGRWPLSLKLINVQLREMVNRGLSVGVALAELTKSLDATGIDYNAEDDYVEPERAIIQALEVSIGQLRDEERVRLTQLAIFPKEVQIPLRLLRRIWHLEEFSVRHLCKRLNDLSLLRFDSDAERVWLRDIVRDYLAELREKELPEFHKELLDLCLPSSGRWADLSQEEGYLWRYLTYHLIEAGEGEALRRLLFDFSFLQTKLLATRDINALISDYGALEDDREPELELVQRALRLGAHIVTSDPSELAGQLLGRLPIQAEESVVQVLKQDAKRRIRFPSGEWNVLFPRFATLTLAGGPLLRTLVGHEDSVNAIAVVDGARVVSGSDDGKLRLWDVESGATLRILVGHEEVKAVAMIGSDRVVSASVDGALRVWDLKSGETLFTIEAHAESVDTVTVVESARAISASEDGTLRVWDLETGRILHALEHECDSVRGVAVAEGGRVISALTGGTLRVWDVESGRTLSILEGHDGSVNAVAVVDGSHVVSASDDCTLRLWSLESHTMLRVFEGHEGSVRAVAVTDVGHIVSASDDHSIRVWDIGSGATVHILSGHHGRVLGVATLDGGLVVSTSDDRTVRVWDFDRSVPLRIPEGHSSHITSVIAADDDEVVSASSDGTLRAWDTESGKRLKTFEGHEDAIQAVVITSVGRIVSASKDCTLRLWDRETGSTVRAFEGHRDAVTAVAVVDRHRIVSGSDDRTLRVWDLESGESLHILEGHRESIWSVAMIDSRHVVSASGDSTLRLWDLDTGETLRTFVGHRSIVRAVILVDGGRIVTASNDHTLRVWDIKSGKSLRTLVGHLGLVRGVAAIDTRRIISASDDCTLGVWDIESGKRHRTHRSHWGWIEAIDVVDRNLVVYASTDNTLRVWNVYTGAQMGKFTLDSGATSVTVFPSDSGKTIVVGDDAGGVHVLDLVRRSKA